MDITSGEPIKEKFDPLGYTSFSGETTHWDSCLTEELATNHVSISDLDE
jgi:hypothetical protein